MALVCNAEGDEVRVVVLPVMPPAVAGAAPTNTQAQAFYLQSQAVAVAVVYSRCKITDQPMHN